SARQDGARRPVTLSAPGEVPPDAGMPPLPESAKARVMHVHLQVGEQPLMGSDTLPAQPGQGAEACGAGYQKPQGLWVSIQVKDEAEGRRVFDGLAEGGSVAMPFSKTFFSSGFGMVTDRFGTPWMVNVPQRAEETAAAPGAAGRAHAELTKTDRGRELARSSSINAQELNHE
ncbi:MAG: VOC family protein, partial [Gammaproteobacteria bacterium]